MFDLNVPTGEMLNRSVAVLMLSTPLDREEKDRYILIVTASDRGEPKLSSNLTVTIIVDDQNDNAPVFFNGDSFNISSVETHIVEKSPVDSVIALIRANDSDVGENARLSYSIENTSGSNYFEIDEALGLVTIKKQIVINTLVDEGIVQPNDTSSILLNLTVRATDHGSPNCSTTLKLVVHIEPINDNSPVFGTCSDEMNVMENKNATFIGRCEAYVENSTISHMHYTLINSFGTFEINEMGNISTTIPLDRETNQMYVLTVRATDGRIPERTAFTTVEVHVEDENDNSPVFYDPGEINITVPENCNFSEWFNVSAYDRDTGANGDVTYVLSSESDDVFSLSNTGGLTILRTFDYENISSYTANITVSDSVHEITKRVTVCIKDLNDNAPAFQDKIGEMVEVSENATLGQEIFQVHANDTDSGWNGVVFYKILNTDPVSPFFIDAISGVVRLDGQLNFEQRSLYSLEIQAYDGGDPSLNSNRTITVNITDVYDDTPQFDHFLYETSIEWSAPVNMSVINLNCTGAVVTYNLTGGDIDKFRVDPLSGEIVVAGTLEKTNDRYFLTVTASDRVNKTATCQVLIKVRGHDVMFSSSNLTAEVLENITSRTLVADLNTTAELRGEHVVYKIESIEPPIGKSLFEINTTTGEVFCNPGVDRETTGQFVLYIRAESLREKRSLAGSTLTFKLVVNIKDVNDNNPMFNPTAVRNFTVPLNSSPGKVVTVLKAYDNDSEISRPFIYRLTSGDNVTFSVNASTGAVVVEQPLTNLEKSLFLLTVEANNGQQPNDTTKINISINVVAVDDTVNITIGMTVGEILERQEELIRRMSDILAVNISIDRVEKHSSALNSEGNHMSFKGVFPDSSDMLIHAHIDGQLVPRNELLELLRRHATELESLFGTRVRRYDPSAITESQLAIICFAVAIFFGAVIAIVFLEHSWSRSQHEYEEHVKRQQQKISEEREMSTLRSRKSSTLSAQNLADSAANQACAETSFSQGVSDMGSGKKEDVQYETQEIRMEFGDEPIDGNLPGPPQAASGTSIVDSGVANTSMQSEDPDQRSNEDLPENSGDPSSNGDEKNETDPDHLRIGSGIGPVMTSSPRISMDGIRFKEPDFTIEAPEHGDDDGNDASYTYVKKKATVRFSGLGGETETDDELSEANDTDDGIEASAEKKETIVSDISDVTVLQETKTDTDTDEDEEDVTVTQF
ncbi:fat-like cadherin-related tumor suppressor homolog [Mya arenaria]|uniref:fat-like cadherin-related tumor suppressor homolog n=1 Tax=Mya arenaria TaxID=6604 RepID=UPI0022E7CC07|nr:fat-like cadherin-related tumor suppressor homolog [Mya arenaria]